MENKTNPTTAGEQKNQTTCQDHLNNNPGGTSMGGGQSDQHDKLNYGSEGCDACQQDFEKNIDSMVGQVENHGQKEHKQQEHEVNAAFGKSGIDSDKPFDSREERSKQSGIHHDGDKTSGKGGVYGQQGQSGQSNPYGQQGQTGQYGKSGQTNQYGQTGQQGQSDWNKSGQQNQYGQDGKSGQQGQNDWNKGGQTGQYGQQNQFGQDGKGGQSGQQGQGDWNKSGQTYGQGQGAHTGTQNNIGKSEQGTGYKKENDKEIK